MISLGLAGLSPVARALHDRLREERVLFDLEVEEELELLRADVERIARGMDDDAEPPTMLWSGVPWPRREGALRGGYSLSISVGGTNTAALLLRVDDGTVRGVDSSGRELSGPELARLAAASSAPTPAMDDTASGWEMVERIVQHAGSMLVPLSERLGDCRHIVLSWGFANKAVRTASHVLGGLTARTTHMTKDQAGFDEDLRGKDVGLLFRQELEHQLGWSRPVTVANDGVMALHYFLTPERRARFSQIGLFINGTGANFCLAEPYAVRPEGVVSAPGESYEPARLTGARALRPGEREERFFVNYEAGSIDLVATRTRYDIRPDYPIESNALSGGNAFEQQFRELVREHLGAEVHEMLLRGFRRRAAGAVPEGPEVSTIATEGKAAVERLFPGADVSAALEEAVVLICRAVIARSALHAALILAAVTRRRRFGLGDRVTGRPDLLGMEGSVWRTRGYPELVRGYWRRLAGEDLQIELDHEPAYNASLVGPAFFAVLHA